MLWIWSILARPLTRARLTMPMFWDGWSSSSARTKLGASGVDDLRQILQFAKASGVDARIKLDPTLARGLAYYTGAIIEINVADLAGSLGGGGRYDNLVGMFLGKDVPACGFSLGLERIIVVMSEREMFPEAVDCFACGCDGDDLE